MKLRDFMERVSARPADVAKATGLHPATVIRLRDEETRRPDVATAMKLTAWSDRIASERGLHPWERVTWDHLLDDPPGKAAAG